MKGELNDDGFLCWDPMYLKVTLTIKNDANSHLTTGKAGGL